RPTARALHRPRSAAEPARSAQPTAPLPARPRRGRATASPARAPRRPPRAAPRASRGPPRPGARDRGSARGPTPGLARGRVVRGERRGQQRMGIAVDAGRLVARLQRLAGAGLDRPVAVLLDLLHDLELEARVVGVVVAAAADLEDHARVALVAERQDGA